MDDALTHDRKRAVGERAENIVERIKRGLGRKSQPMKGPLRLELVGLLAGQQTLANESFKGCDFVAERFVADATMQRMPWALNSYLEGVLNVEATVVRYRKIV